MKTKNILVLAALIFSSILNVNGLFAQSQTDDKVTLNIVLNQIQSIVVNPDHKTVDLKYSTMDNYKNGVQAVKEKHLTVFSTGGFKVTVKSGEFLTSETGGTINASDVTVLVTNASENDVANTATTPVSLGTEQTLISSETGGRDLEYNVTYNNELLENNKDKYLNLYKATEGGTNTFTTTVTYTIAAM